AEKRVERLQGFTAPQVEPEPHERGQLLATSPRSICEIAFSRSRLVGSPGVLSHSWELRFRGFATRKDANAATTEPRASLRPRVDRRRATMAALRTTVAVRVGTSRRFGTGLAADPDAKCKRSRAADSSTRLAG